VSISDKARKIPGVAATEGAITGALATEQDLPIAGYDKQTAEDIASRLNGFSQRELRMIERTSASIRTARRSPTRSPSSAARSRGQATTSKESTRSRRPSTTRTP
jgi:hypothetical protein